MMITNLDYSSPQLEKIDDLLLDEVKVMPVRYCKRKFEFRHADKIYKNIYKNNFIGFPVDVVPRGYDVYITQDALINYHKYHALRNKTPDAMLLKMIDNTSDLQLRELVSNMIHEKIMNLSFEFEAALKWARSSYTFAGIKDNVTIIRNVLNMYITVRKKDDVQISHFAGITLPKAISDLMTDIYIIYLSDRLQMLELKNISGDQPFSTNMEEGQKIRWNGKQQHLAELFLELEKNKWIGGDELSMRKAANLLCRIFDLSNTQRKKDSNSADSLYQLLKGEIDKDDEYQRKYFFDTDKKYKRQFQNLQELRK